MPRSLENKVSPAMPVESVILDTNVFVAALFNPGSDSARLLEEVRLGHLRMVWNEQTRRETERILNRIPPLSWDSAADVFRAEDRCDAETFPERFDYIPDPEDRKYAALAAAAGAVLVTNDDHLLSNRERAGLTIVTPREFRERRSGGPLAP